MKDEIFVHKHLNVFNSLLNDPLRLCVKVDNEEQATLLFYLMSDS